MSELFSYASWFNKLPDINLSICYDYYDLFFETMFKRQEIWYNRFILKKPRPWSDNVILNDFKFTNVYRELDRNSQWQIKNIILNKNLSIKNMIWQMMFFRIFNNIETFEFAKNCYGYKTGIPDYEEYDKDEWNKVLKVMRELGKNPYTNAYLINSKATPGKPRDYCYGEVVIPTLHKSISSILKTMLIAKKPEEIISEFLKLPAVATFIAHEFYQDFTYLNRYTNKNIMKFNQNDFTNVGPGASLGIRLIFPSLNGSEQKEAIYKLQYEAEFELKKFGDFKYLYWDKIKNQYYTNSNCNITLHQVEMWLCEFQKYWKILIQEGKQRSKFVEHTQIK